MKQEASSRRCDPWHGIRREAHFTSRDESLIYVHVHTSVTETVPHYTTSIDFLSTYTSGCSSFSAVHYNIHTASITKHAHYTL